jgi:hypothetical protein
MSVLHRIIRVLAFDRCSLRALAERRVGWFGLIWLSAGFLAYVLVRNYVYADLSSNVPLAPGLGLLGDLLNLNLIQLLLFLSVVYLPALIALANAFAGDGLGFTISKDEYLRHMSGLFPMWGVLFLVAAPVQYFVPQFLVLEDVGIAVGLLTLLLLTLVYTVWAIGELDCIALPLAGGVFALACATLPVFYLAMSSVTVLVLLLLLAGFLVRWARAGQAKGTAAQRRLGEQPGTKDDSVDSLRSPLETNPPDPEARLLLAVELRQRGEIDGMRAQLHAILEQARSHPRFFRQDGREWVLRARALLFDSRRSS